MKPYYQDSSVTIYHGDCREIVPQLGKFDLLLTDPPYGTEDLGGGYGRRQNHDPNGKFGRRIEGDKDLSLAREVFSLCRTLISNGYAQSFCAPRRMDEMFTILPEAEYLAEIIWDKGTPGLGYTVRYSHESSLLWKIGEPEKPEKALKSVIHQQVTHLNAHLRHPHEKPIKFWKNSLLLPGESILDPFMGSGTTLRAAKDLGRKGVGIELEEKYCEIAAGRMSQEVLAFE